MGAVMTQWAGLEACGQLAATNARFSAQRAAGAVAWDADLDAWAVYRHAEAKQVLTDWQAFSSARESPGVRPSLLTTDPPRHTVLRRVVAKAFTPRAVAALEPRMRALAEELLAGKLGHGPFDLVADYAHPFPVTVIAEMLGVPAADRPLYRRWADAIVGGAGARVLLGAHPTPAALEARSEMDAWFSAQLDRPGRADEDDILGALLAARESDGLTTAEILSFCSLLLLAGHITTVNLITNATYCLSSHPERLAELIAAPERVGDAVEEVLRYMSPVQGVSRVATRPVELGGVMIGAGQRVVAWIASANRDERVFHDPDRFDFRRHPNPHLSFGAGIHFCLGAALSRLEARVALRALLGSLSQLRPSDSDPPRLGESATLLGFERLTLEDA